MMAPTVDVGYLYATAGTGRGGEEELVLDGQDGGADVTGPAVCRQDVLIWGGIKTLDYNSDKAVISV
jgi:hypothetical protein